MGKCKGYFNKIRIKKEPFLRQFRGWFFFYFLYNYNGCTYPPDDKSVWWHLIPNRIFPVMSAVQ
ncbi:hypothetical protein GCM10028868_33420 [Virgibacillus kimchii]